jgi:signal transduction histidine kinase/ActR/RegA family two-component response regulator
MTPLADPSAAEPTTPLVAPDALAPAAALAPPSRDHGALRRFAGRVRAMLPQGQTLPQAAWERRHRAMLWLLWAHAVLLPAYGATRGYDLFHSLLHGAPIAVAAALGAFGSSRRFRSSMVSLGLLSSAALLVHSSGGVIEAHFHFFVVIVVLTLYEDWMPFLLAVAYVVLHHGLAGVLDSGAVYNHADAVAQPWKWAGIHGAFVFAAGVACVVSWRLNEDVRSELWRAEEAQRANQAKTEFLSRVSHELRTPLNSILGFAQLLEMDQLEAHQHDGVRRIRRGGAHLLTLIDEVLEISAIESGEMRISLEPVFVGGVVKEVLDLVAPLAAEHEVRVVTRVGDGYVLADYQRLKQVLLNLLSNSVKYNRAGGAATVSMEPAGEGRVRIVVDDTGRGIAQEHLPKLFQPFERLGADQSSVEGIGLGLALSRGLVQAMNGTIDVRSEVGIGTRVTVEFAQAEPPIASAGAAAADPPAIASNGELAQARVLCIEDNPSNLELIEQIFARRPDMELLTAGQGTLGIELAQQHRPDVVLLDVNLPDMPGHEVLRRLREDPRSRDVPVIVLSADATEAQVRRMTGLGAQAYLAKPIDVRALLCAVDESLEAGGSLAG